MSQYIPDAGDIAWVHFSPHAGSETAFRHPAIVLTPRTYSVATGLALVVPVTSKVKGGSFEVPITGVAPVSGRKPVQGVALANELRTIDYVARQVEPADRCSPSALARIKAIARALIDGA